MVGGPQRAGFAAAAGFRVAPGVQCFVTRARLQPGRKQRKITAGFSPCGMWRGPIQIQRPKPGTTPGTVKLLLSPRQSRGFSRLK